MASIGSIFVDFIARTAGFQQNCQQAAATLQQTGASMNQSMNGVSKTGDQMTNAMARSALKVGASFLGARTVAMALSREIKDVYQNIDKIPGVPQSTIDSIHMMKYELEGTNSVLKQGIAGMLGAFSDFGQKIGFGFGAMAYGADAAADAFGKMTEEAEAFANKDFDKKFEKLQKEMDRLQMTSGELAASLIADADALDKYAAGADGTVDERHQATLDAGKERIEAQRTLNGLQKEFRKLIDEDSSVEEKYQLKLMGHSKAVEFLAAKEKELIAERDNLTGTDFDAMYGDPKQLELVNEKQKEINATHKLWVQEVLKTKEPLKLMRDEFVQAFSGISDVMAETIMTGKANFAGFFKSLAQQMVSMMIKLSIINPLMNAMFGTTTGWTTLAHFADGGDPEVGKASLVGERGPELFVPKTAGTIIPNHALGGSGGGTVNNIHVHYNVQSGVTRNELQPLFDMHARRIKGEISNALSRGGSPAAALSRR